MSKSPLFIAGLILTIFMATLLFILPEGPDWQAATLVTMFGLATGLALTGAGYALKA
ncbi:hypothetical protein ACOTHJ_12640 [Achromobacter xylosoxidans]